MINKGAIGVFDSGYGGLTVLESLQAELPSYDFIYLGDNARTPYGSRSFEVIYQYTLEAVKFLFKQGCPLVILACNTASAKALRTIQQNDLASLAPTNRVLGVLRPTTEEIGTLTSSGHVGVLGTNGTINSNSYAIEIKKFFPALTVVQKSCPMWVPLVENNEFDNVGGEFYIKKYIDEILHQDDEIDTLVLACTHYPILEEKIKKHLPKHIRLVSQGNLVASKLKTYLNRHSEINDRLTKTSALNVLTTECNTSFDLVASKFYKKEIKSITVKL
ncbi:glutamate racemase [Flavobacteriales bacterium]|nr:glutamate racemase [Flavobacteriales bacterium]